MASLSSSYLIDPPSVSSINHSLVNSNSFDASPALFGNTVSPAAVNCRALPEPANSIQAAASFVPGLTMKGGSRRKRTRSKNYLKRIKNIANMYKMKGTRKSIRRRIRRLKSRLRSRFTMKSRKNHKRSNRRHHNMSGGYAQFQNNMPSTPGMATGGYLSPSMSALASPPIYQRIPGDSSVDNLNHNALNSFGKSGAGMGFPSRGWH
jgi:hypothetical protein